jgi:hypothetical protein
MSYIKADQQMKPTTASTPNQPEIEPVFPIPAVYLLHGKGGSPEGTVKKLQAVLEQHWPGLGFVRPRLPRLSARFSSATPSAQVGELIAMT